MKPKALFVMLILWLSFTTIQARSTEDVPDKGTYAKFLLVGCYMKPDEEGVRMYRFDGQTADVDYPCGLRGISNPAFLTSDSTGNRIYAIGDDEGKSSTANALLFDKESGLLSLLNSQSTDGELPIYITLSPKEYFVLTANYTAKQKGVKTGQALWQAKSACPDLVVVPPRMELYLQFSSMLREIYGEYTDLVEPYGCDEAWLDVTGSTALKGDEKKIADEIRSRVKKELGITVSIGISWNKIFAKLGSDYKKPDAITQFHKENYQSIVWNLPAANLLYVGRSTRTMLNRYGIKTIGKIATSDPDFLERLFGKMGLVLYSFANGWDDSPVAPEGYAAPIKSIGNSTTTPRDLATNLNP